MQYELTPRLQACAALCADARRVADIGCDHAYLSIALAEAGAEVLASDLRAGPLETARKNVLAAGMEGRIRLRRGDGLAGLSPEDCDAVVIAGMGGETIAEILRAAPWTADGRHRLILQPQTRARELRQFLAENGYTVEREVLAQEDPRLYVVLCARGGQPPMGEEDYYYCTPRMYADPLFPLYVARLRAHLTQVAAGRHSAGLEAEEQERVLRRLEVLADGA